MQTRDGYIWLGTDGGLVRFNGEAFTAFTVQSGALKDNEVWALQEDDEGGLWIGTYGGGLTLLRNGRFQTFTTANGLPDDVILSLAKDGQGNIWVITPQGLVRGAHGSFRRVGGMPEPRATAVCASPAAGVVVGTRTGIYHAAGDAWERRPLSPSSEGGMPGNTCARTTGRCGLATATA